MGIPRPNAGHAAVINKSPSKEFIWYFILVSLITSLSSFILFIDFENVATYYLIIQFITLIFGSIHIYFLNKKLKWHKDFLLGKKLLFTYAISLCSMLFFYLLCRYVVLRNEEGYSKLYITSILVFILPLFVVATFDKAMQIEPRNYKLWFYNDNANSQDPDLIDFTNSYLLSFEFPKKYNDQVISNFKFKAPLDMQFGELFYNYIKEYNDAHRENAIEYLDQMSNSYGWLFALKKKSWWQNDRIIDPHLSIRQNKILEHDVILPKRFIVA
jgi:hypothetical protein